MWARLLAVLRKEFIQMRRDRLTLGMMMMIPVVQLIVFGFAINTDVKHLPTVVYDQCYQQESRELVQAFQNSQYYDIVAYVQSYDEVTRYIDSGRAKVGIVFPPDFTTLIKTRKPAPVQVLVDASDPMTASTALSTAGAIGQIKSQQIMIQVLRQLGGKVMTEPPVDVRVRAWYNPDMLTAHFAVPGLLAIILTMTMVMITAMAIVRERERGTLEQLIVTPVSPLELMIGKIVPYIVVGYAQITLALLVGRLVFDVPVNGSITLLYLLTFVFIVANLGVGLLISTVAKTQQQAMQMSFFIFLPAVLLSGFMFPREGMPVIIQYLSLIFPATFYLQIIRGIILKGVGLPYLWPQVLSLAVFAVMIIGISVRRFKKKLT